MTGSGIITFHYGLNFGGVLQAVALQSAVEELGTSTEIIDYVPPTYDEPRWWQGWSLRSGVDWTRIRGRMIQGRHEKAARAGFDAFRSEYMSRSRRVRDKAACRELFNNYDLLIAGSDQIWHFDRSESYFLETSEEFTGRKISYASCAGGVVQSQDRRAVIRGLLRSFSHVSVRNSFTAELVEGVTGEKPTIVVDPTLLVDQTSLQSPVILPFDRFILCYFLGSEIVGGHSEMVRHIRLRVGNLPVVAVVSPLSPQPTSYADHVIYDANPAQWLWLINNSDFVYTDSYHGLLFALRAERPSLAYRRETIRSPRMVDVADRYELHRHLVPGVEAAQEATGWEEPISAESIRRIEDHVEFSRSYLRDALAG